MVTPVLVIVPTRGRPDRFAEFLQAWEDTSDGSAQLLACLDDDDPTGDSYPEIPAGICGGYVTGPRNGFAPRLSAEAMIAIGEPGSPLVIGNLGDDHLPRTKGWDGAILAAARDLKHGVIYPNDLLQFEQLPTAPFLTTSVVEALGFFTPACLAHMYVDNFWRALGIGIEGLRYLPDVIIEHMHPNAIADHDPDARKGAWDEVYESSSNRDASVADLHAWEAYRASGQLAADIARVRSSVGLRSTEWKT